MDKKEFGYEILKATQENVSNTMMGYKIAVLITEDKNIKDALEKMIDAMQGFIDVMDKGE